MTLLKTRNPPSPEGRSPSGGGGGLVPTMPCLGRLTARKELVVISRCFQFVLQREIRMSAICTHWEETWSWSISHRLLVHCEGYQEGACMQVRCKEEAQFERRCGKHVL